MVGKAEWTNGEANPRFVVTSLKPIEQGPRELYENVYCARGDMENRIKESQADLFADRTSTATMTANQLRLWFSSFAYVLVCAVRRIGLRHTQFADATAGTIRLKLFKIGALVKVSARADQIRAPHRLSLRQRMALGRLLPRPRRSCLTRRRTRPKRGIQPQAHRRPETDRIPAQKAQRTRSPRRSRAVNSRQTSAAAYPSLRNAG